jgi:hypothetical protein
VTFIPLQEFPELVSITLNELHFAKVVLENDKEKIPK